MSARRSALGRGLGALITKNAEAPAAALPERESVSYEDLPAPSGERGTSEISVDAIRPNPDQPRRIFDPDHLKELSESIARHGVLQPVVVRRAEDDNYELIVGERRWRASRAAGKATIPAVVADIAPAERLEIAIVENVQRHDLNAIELAHAYQALAETGATQDEIGKRVGLDRSSVANHLRLLELPTDIQSDVESERLSMGHAKALLSVGNNPERQRQLRDRAVAEALSVRAVEALARDYASPSGKAPTKPKAKSAERGGAAGAKTSDPRLEPLAEALRQQLQTQVRIVGGLEEGHIEVDYFGSEDLERIAEIMLRDV